MEIKLRTNEFWGDRAGYYDPRINKNTGLINGFRIDLSKWNQGRENTRAVGKRSRKNKNYENPKLRRKNYV